MGRSGPARVPPAMAASERRLARFAVLEAADPAGSAAAAVKAVVQAGSLHWIWKESSAGLPQADVVFLVDAGGGEWALRRVRELRRAGFTKGIVVFAERQPGAPTPAPTPVPSALGCDEWFDFPLQGTSPLQVRLAALAYRLRADADDDDDHLVGLDPELLELRIGTVTVPVRTQTRFRILTALVPCRPTWIRGPDLVRLAFSTHHDADSSVVRVHVHGIRQIMKAVSFEKLGQTGLEHLLESETGLGYRFNLRAPAAKSALARVRGSGTRLAAAKSLLLVEDDPLVVQAFVRRLARRHFDVVPVLNCKCAREQVRRFHHALIDKSLPDGDGIDLGAELLRAGRVESVTFMTAHPTAGDVYRSYGVGPVIDKADGFEVIAAALATGNPARHPG